MAFIITLIIIGAVFVVVADDIDSWLVYVSICSIFAAFVFLISGYWDTPTLPKQNQTQQQKQTPTAPPPDDTHQPVEPPPASPPNDQKKDPPPPNMFQKFANDTMNDSESVHTVCHDGIQYQLSMWLYTDKDSTSYGSPQSVVVWPRIHQDGKPYTCSESKDPAKEISK